MFLLDTCALSELVAKRPNPHAVEAIIALPQDQWFIAAATVGEIRRGIDELDNGKPLEFSGELVSGTRRGHLPSQGDRV